MTWETQEERDALADNRTAIWSGRTPLYESGELPMSDREEYEIKKFTTTEFAVGGRTGLTTEIIARCSREANADRIMRALVLLPGKEAELVQVKERVRKLEAALKKIAAYGKDGICPYGCDTPDIAQKALGPQTPAAEKENCR